MVPTVLCASNDDDGDDIKDELLSEEEEEEEEVEPGKMRVSEITAELRLRGVDFSDCFEKDALVERLKEARATGKANPDIIDNFNKRKLEETFQEKKLEISDEAIDQALANDGKLPGGMSPDVLKSMISNPEVMALLQNPKMQDAMKLMMSGGREELEKAITNDPELQEIVEKLNKVMRGVL